MKTYLHLTLNAMLKSLSALSKLRLQKLRLQKRRSFIWLLFFAALLMAGIGLFAQEMEVTDADSDADDEQEYFFEPPPPIRWYRSNGAGMALELIPSQVTALQNEYAMSVEILDPDRLPWALPAILRPYYSSNLRVELRSLFEHGSEIRRQWTFRDARGTSRVFASGRGPLFGFEVQRAEAPAVVQAPEVTETPEAAEGEAAEVEEYEDDNEDEKAAEDEDEDGEETEEPEDPAAEEPEEPPEPRSSGFIEILNPQGAVLRELQFNEDLSEWDFRFTYRDGILLRTESWYKEPPLPPVIEEELTEEDPEEEDPENEELESEELEGEEPEENEEHEEAASEVPPVVIPPPVERRDPVFVRLYTDVYRYNRSGGVRSIDRTFHEHASIARTNFPHIAPRASIPIIEELPLSAGVYSASYFWGEQFLEGMTVSFNLDTRGRVLAEIWRNEDGSLIGELRNVWAGDRLSSVAWRTDNEEQLIEFEYDSGGDRMVERNFRNGVLERRVTNQGDTELEELFMNGRLVLRAIWRDGLRISEERVR